MVSPRNSRGLKTRSVRSKPLDGMCMGRVETAVLFVPLRKIEQRKRSEMKPAIRKDRHSGDIPALVRTQHQHRAADILLGIPDIRSEEHTSELQSLMRISYAVFFLKKKTQRNT